MQSLSSRCTVALQEENDTMALPQIQRALQDRSYQPCLAINQIYQSYPVTKSDATSDDSSTSTDSRHCDYLDRQHAILTHRRLSKECVSNTRDWDILPLQLATILTSQERLPENRHLPLTNTAATCCIALASKASRITATNTHPVILAASLSLLLYLILFFTLPAWSPYHRPAPMA